MIDHPSVQAVQQALDTAGARDETAARCRVVILDDSVHTADEAAAHLGVSIGQIANSLIFDADGEPLLVLTSGAHRVDTAWVAACLSVHKLRRATPDFVREHTSQAIGGVAPVGHPKPVRTVIDTALAAYTHVWTSGGIPRAVFAITYDELLRITAATPLKVARHCQCQPPTAR
jgi:prolyl-tRNA editing enzyme YbaK/EbsC (Cys-tRNA(Pro) deacylase)